MPRLSSESNRSPVKFSSSSLLHIQRAAVEELCRYLDQHDPFDHERRYGSVSGLLKVIEEIDIPFPDDLVEAAHNLEDLRTRTNRFLNRLACAPLADPTAMAALLGAATRARKTPSSLNLHRYTWDLWELRALVAGVSADLAEIGRGAIRRMHFCANHSIEIEPDMLLNMALKTPEQVETLFMRMMVQSSMSCIPNIKRSTNVNKTYN